ncbi:lysylphosphatidylglycerol synthase transmembrane domain-containing protein [Pediococcus pentosaceus]
MSRRNKVVLAVMIIAGIIIFGFSLRNVNLNQMARDVVHLNMWWLLVALGCIVLYLGLEAVATKMLIQSNGDRLSWRDATRIPLIEQLFNGITPFSSGGQPAQLVALMQNGIEGGRASSVLLMKFVVFQSMVVINFIFSLLIGFQYLEEKIRFLSWFVLFGFLIHLAVIIGLLMIMYWHNFTKRLISAIFIPIKHFVSKERYTTWKVTLNEKVDSFYQESVRMKSQWRLLAKVALVTFLQLLFYYLIPYFILLALGKSDVNIVMVTCLHVLIFMVISLFPIPGGAGGAEYGFSVIFAQFVGNNSKLVLAMMIWRILTYYFGMFAGMVATVVKPHKVNRVKVVKNE